MFQLLHLNLVTTTTATIIIVAAYHGCCKDQIICLAPHISQQIIAGTLLISTGW